MEDHWHFGRCPLCETTDIHQILRRQESLIADNMTLIFSRTRRFHSLEVCRSDEYAFIMETLIGEKRQIESLQAEHVTLQQMVSNLARSSNSAVSNARLSIGSVTEEIKEDTVQQHHGDVEMIGMYYELGLSGYTRRKPRASMPLLSNIF